jgi:hypothetical protein
MYAAKMLLRILPLITGLLPIIAIHLSYLIAILAGKLPLCNPYIHGCVSISATGRYPPASFLFKAAMMPEAIILAIYWLVNVAWLRALNRSAGETRAIGTAIGGFGVAGALFLILYVTFLGTQEPFYEFMRRFGVYLYFLFSVIAQIILAVKVLRLPAGICSPFLIRITKIQLTLSLIPFVLGILNMILKSILEDSNPSERVIEWMFALMMQSYFVLSYFSWRDTQFTAGFLVRRE